MINYDDLFIISSWIFGLTIFLLFLSVYSGKNDYPEILVYIVLKSMVMALIFNLVNKSMDAQKDSQLAEKSSQQAEKSSQQRGIVKKAEKASQKTTIPCIFALFAINVIFVFNGKFIFVFIEEMINKSFGAMVFYSCLLTIYELSLIWSALYFFSWIGNRFTAKYTGYETKFVCYGNLFCNFFYALHSFSYPLHINIRKNESMIWTDNLWELSIIAIKILFDICIYIYIYNQERRENDKFEGTDDEKNKQWVKANQDNIYPIRAIICLAIMFTLFFFVIQEEKICFIFGFDIFIKFLCCLLEKGAHKYFE